MSSCPPPALYSVRSPRGPSPRPREACDAGAQAGVRAGAPRGGVACSVTPAQGGAERGRGTRPFSQSPVPGRSWESRTGVGGWGSFREMLGEVCRGHCCYSALGRVSPALHVDHGPEASLWPGHRRGRTVFPPLSLYYALTLLRGGLELRRERLMKCHSMLITCNFN